MSGVWREVFPKVPKVGERRTSLLRRGDEVEEDGEMEERSRTEMMRRRGSRTALHSEVEAEQSQQ